MCGAGRLLRPFRPPLVIPVPFVVPAKAGIQRTPFPWTPAFAGVTSRGAGATKEGRAGTLRPFDPSDMVRPFDKLRDRRLTNQAQDIAGSGIAGACLYFTAGGWGTLSLALPQRGRVLFFMGNDDT